MQPTASPLAAESDRQPFSPERAIIPAVSDNREHSHLSNNGFNVIRNPIAEALYETGQFISRYDPLTFPGAAATPVNDRTYIGKEGDERVIIKDIDDNIVELNRNYYQLANRPDSEQFINNGKKALVKFYENYNSKYPELIL